MARYPTYDEYREKPAKGIQRCDDLLRRDPGNVHILLTKLQLQVTLPDAQAANETLERLYARQPKEIADITTIEEAVVELQGQTYPTPLTAGPEVAKLWEGAYKSSTSTNHKLDIQSLRFTRALLDNRLVDAQQSLIQLKALSPGKRVFYMAHVALTQMLSTAETDLQSRLALSLARKSVTEKFDDETKLDCRVPGQIFALQASKKDLESISGRRFADSKQVFDAQRKQQTETKDKTVPKPEQPGTVPSKAWLNQELACMEEQFKALCESQSCNEQQCSEFAANAVRLFVLATTSLDLQKYRPVSGAVFLAISSLVKAWTLSPTPAYLLQASFLAESLLRLQPKVHEAKVILVYLYMKLGLGSLAYREWDELSIREVQYDTFGHTFLTQLSITHPHYLGDIDPSRLVKYALGVYRRCEEKLANTYADVLGHGQTGMIFDLYDMRKCLRLSATRRLLSLEHRRLARLNNDSRIEHSISVDPRLTSAWLDIKDTRDFSAAFNYGFDIERALHERNDVEVSVLLGLAADSVWCKIHNQQPLITDTRPLLTKLKSLFDKGAATEYEWLAGELVILMLDTILSAEEDEKPERKTQLVDAIKNLHIDTLVVDSRCLPLQIKCVYSYLDTLRIAAAFSKYAESKKILSKDEAAAVRDTATTAYNQLQSYSKDRAAAIEALAVKDLMHTSIKDELASLGADQLTSFCALVVESTRNAWAGVAQYRI